MGKFFLAFFCVLFDFFRSGLAGLDGCWPLFDAFWRFLRVKMGKALGL